MGYRTFHDLVAARPSDLELALGGWGEVVRKLARGEDERAVDPLGVAKSLGHEETFERDLTSRDAIALRLLAQSMKVAQRLVEEGFSARTVTVKLKYADFSVKTRRATLADPVMDTTSIHEAARALLAKLPEGPVRLTGVSASSLSPGPPPERLFAGDDAKKRRKLEELASAVRAKLGTGALTRASLLALEDERPNFESPKPE